MEKRLKTSVVSGVLATIVMSLTMYLLSFLGMPKMSPPHMLTVMVGIPLFAGWLIHFFIGISFALAYTYLCKRLYSIRSAFIRGIIYGVIVFIVAQIMMGIMGSFLPMPTIEESIVLVMITSLIGHIIFGIVVVRIIDAIYCEENS